MTSLDNLPYHHTVRFPGRCGRLNGNWSGKSNGHGKPNGNGTRSFSSVSSISSSGSMGSESPPAGFFSTFSIIDPNSSGGGLGGGGPDGGGQSRSQKRNRRVFVCIPCHRRKLKCDKNLPCGRCVAYGAADECVYQSLPSSSGPGSGSTAGAGVGAGAGAGAGSAPRSEPSSEPQEASRASSQVGIRERYRTFYRPSDGKCRATGTSHWAAVCCEFEEACPYLFGTDPQWEPRYRLIKNLKYLFPSLAGANFPLSTSSPYSASKDQILTHLPPRAIVEALVGGYMTTFETTHRLLHRVQFQQELEAFWADRENVLDGWLSQLCMMLALGCQAAPQAVLEGTGQTAGQWTEILLDGAQISLGRSPYMLMPSLTTIRTLCMMVVAKMVGLRGSSSWQVAALMGLVASLAMNPLQLHRSAAIFHGMPDFEAEARRRVWTTVRLLDLDVAMWAGTTLCCREQDAEPPAVDWSAASVVGGGGGEAEFGAREGGSHDDYYYHQQQHYQQQHHRSGQEPDPDGTFQVKLSELLPLLAEAVNPANSPTGPGVEYEKALRLHKRIRLRLQDAEQALTAAAKAADSSNSNNNSSTSSSNKNNPSGGAGGGGGKGGGGSASSVASHQRQFLRVLAHRALLALHHPFARGGQPQRHEQSHRASLESSLALLQIQQHWVVAAAAGATSATGAGTGTSSTSTSTSTTMVAARSRSTPGGRSTGSSSPMAGAAPVTSSSSSSSGPTASATGAARLQWLLDLCRDDFGIAAAYAILALRRGDFDDHNHNHHEGGGGGGGGAPCGPEAASAAVGRALAVTRARACRSVLHFKEFTGLSILAGCMRCLGPRGGGGGADYGSGGGGGGVGGAGGGGNFLAALMAVAEDVEDVVLTGRSEALWCTSTAAAAAAAAAAAGAAAASAASAPLVGSALVAGGPGGGGGGLVVPQGQMLLLQQQQQQQQQQHQLLHPGHHPHHHHPQLHAHQQHGHAQGQMPHGPDAFSMMGPEFMGSFQ